MNWPEVAANAIEFICLMCKKGYWFCYFAMVVQVIKDYIFFIILFFLSYLIKDIVTRIFHILFLELAVK